MLPPLGLCLTIVLCCAPPVALGEPAGCDSRSRLPGEIGSTHPVRAGAARIDWNVSFLPSLTAWLIAHPGAQRTSARPPPQYGTLATGLATHARPASVWDTGYHHVRQQLSVIICDGGSTRCLKANNLRHH